MRRIIALLTCCLALCGAAAAKDYNPTPSPDGKMLAFTRDNDLWVRSVADSVDTRLTFDGSQLILNGYASWVYYEEILGRASNYRAFWWSPDSRKIGFYRFDNSDVPMFPIFSPFGQNGSLSQTRYPKAGQTNPQVRVGIIDLQDQDRMGRLRRDRGPVLRDSVLGCRLPGTVCLARAAQAECAGPVCRQRGGRKQA